MDIENTSKGFCV